MTFDDTIGAVGLERTPICLYYCSKSIVTKLEVFRNKAITHLENSTIKPKVQTPPTKLVAEFKTFLQCTLQGRTVSEVPVDSLQ
jgi:hypothetical protein